MIRDYQLTIPAGGSVTQQVKGSYLGLMRSSNDAQIIRFEAIGEGGEVVANVGLFQGDKLPSTGKPYHSVTVTNPGAYDVVVTIIAGDGAYQSDRSSGLVSVEGVVTVSEIKQNESTYSAIVGATSAAGYYGYIELHNPVGSGVIVKSRDIGLKKDTTGVIFYKVKDPKSPTPTVKAYPISGEGQSKAVYGVFPSAIQQQYITEYPVGGDATTIGWGGVMTPQYQLVSSKAGVELAEGESIVGFYYGASQKMEGFLMWSEEVV